MCVGCQYNKAFEDLKVQLEGAGVSTVGRADQVTAGEFPIAGPKKLLGNVFSYSHWVILIVLMFGDKFLPSMGIIPPPIYYKLKEKQFMVIIASYFITSQLSSYFLNSGAFEVYCNDELIFSKLASNRLPEPQHILSLVESSRS